jgi:hypothetical protein
MGSFLIGPRHKLHEYEKRGPQRRHLEDRLENYIRTSFIRISHEKKGRTREPYFLRVEKVTKHFDDAILAWQSNRDQIIRSMSDIGIPTLRILLGEDFQTIISLRPISPKKPSAVRQHAKPLLPKFVSQVVDLTMDSNDDESESLPDPKTFAPGLPTLDPTINGPATWPENFPGPSVEIFDTPLCLWKEPESTASIISGSNNSRTLPPLGPATSNTMNHNFNGTGGDLKRKSESNGDENLGVELKRPRFDDFLQEIGFNFEMERQAGENLPPLSSVLGADVPPLSKYGPGF